MNNKAKGITYASITDKDSRKENEINPLYKKYCSNHEKNTIY